MALKDFPQWVLDCKQPRQEIRVRDGKYYVYECSSVYDKTIGRARKKTGRYLGRITEAEGFVPASRRMLPADEASEPRKMECKIVDGQVADLEYGFCHFYRKAVQATYAPLLKKHFPDCWQTIVAMSYCRAMYQSPLKRMQADWKRSYMSAILKDAHMSQRYLTGFIRDLGKRRADVVAFCQEFAHGISNIIFDGTDIISASKLMDINRYSKTKSGTYDDVFNVMCAFSVDKQYPVFYHILQGNQKDVSVFCDSLDTFMVRRDQTVIVVDPESESPLDKGFASERNLTKMEDVGMHYVVGIRRNDSHLDYSCLQMRNNSGMDGVFEYEGRLIWYKDLEEWSTEHLNRRVYLFYDEEMASREKKDFEKRNKGRSDYAAAYMERCLRFGTMGMVTNSGKDAEQTYFSYKSRGQVEDMISTLKTVVGADATYMQDETALEGWMFPNYLALHWHYVMRHILVEKEMLRKQSSRDMFQIFSGVRKIQIGGKWKLTNIIRADQKILKKAGLLPDMDARYMDLGEEESEAEQ